MKTVGWTKIIFEKVILKIMTQTLEEPRWLAIEKIRPCEIPEKFVDLNNFACVTIKTNRLLHLKKKKNKKNRHMNMSSSGLLLPVKTELV